MSMRLFFVLIRTNSTSGVCYFLALADFSEVLVKTRRSSSAVEMIRDFRGNRSFESRMTRRSRLRRGKPLRSVRRGSSARMVPIPVNSASEAWRMRWTSARDSSEVIQEDLWPLPDFLPPFSADDGKASWPSSVNADFSVTNGFFVRIQYANASFRRRASSSQTPEVT